MSRRSHKVDREFRRNIKGVLERDGRTPFAPTTGAGALFVALAGLFAVLLPLSLVLLAAGLVFRVPDMMAFEIGRSEALAELGFSGVAAADAADDIAAFLTHKQETLTLTAEVAHKNAPVFTFMDEANLGKARALLDRWLYPPIFGFALAMALFAVCRLAQRQAALRHSLRAGAFAYAAAAFFALCLGLSAPFREKALVWLGIAPSPGDVLPRLLGGYYPLISMAAVCLVSFIIYIVLFSLLWRFTKEKEKMFG